MEIFVKLFAGSQHDPVVTQEDINKNIAALDRAIKGKSQAGDFMFLAGTKSILEDIKKQLPEK